jgi:hypothetical protein
MFFFFVFFGVDSPLWLGVVDVGLIPAVAGLSKFYKSSLVAVLRVAFPEHQWLPWKFKRAPRNWWADPSNRRAYFEWLGKRLGMKDYRDWYHLTSTDIIGNDGMFGRSFCWSSSGEFLTRFAAYFPGSSMLNRYYNCSVPVAVMSVFPEHKWDRHRFESRESTPTNEAS